MEASPEPSLLPRIIGTWRWLAKADNRETAKRHARHRVCRHQWEPINTRHDDLVLITADEEWCVKCDARR